VAQGRPAVALATLTWLDPEVVHNRVGRPRHQRQVPHIGALDAEREQLGHAKK
jgi:hypothetical protein